MNEPLLQRDLPSRERSQSVCWDHTDSGSARAVGFVAGLIVHYVIFRNPKGSTDAR
jgi:hypothetical protein